MRPRWLHLAALTAALSAVYVAAAKFGLWLGVVEQVSAVWPPAGIALAAVLLWGPRAVPGIALGAFLANALSQEPLAVAGGIAIGNALEALAGAWLLRRVAGFDPTLGRLRDVLSLGLLAAAASTMISATIGVTCLCAGGVHPWSTYRSLWSVWWLGDAVGDLVVAPLLLALADRRRITRSLGRWAEAGALLSGLVIVSVLVFGPQVAIERDDLLEYFIFPFVIWAGLRFGPGMTAVVTFVASAVAIWGTLTGAGSFPRWQAGSNPLILLQTFMAVVSVTGLLLSAAVSERRKVQESLQREHDLLDAITAETTDAVFVKDLAGRYLMINEAGARFLGMTAADVLGKDDSELFSPDTARGIMDRDRQVMQSGQTQTYEDIGTAAGVTRTYLSTKGPYRDHSGRVIGLIGISRDITERKRLEEELRQRNAQLAEADRRKDEFLAMLSHELRNPLAPIRNAVELLRVSGLDDERLGWARDILDRQMRQLTRLVDDLLDVSRISQGKIVLQTERVELQTVAARAVEISRPLIDSRGHTFEIALPAAAVWLEADPARLAQVLANLLNNAAKYTETGGRIMLAAGREGPDVVIRVQDTGVGIGPEMLGRLFVPFAQAERSLDRSEGGLGLGLSLVRSLVELHGGTVTAQSRGPGLGSEFIVRLPVAEAPAEPASTKAEGPPVVGPRRVLVVDDSPDGAHSLALVLRYQGHEVTVAYDGASALAQARTCRPEVVLLDIGLPGMDGYDVARRLRQDPELADVLLVALTGYGQDHDRRRSREAGFDCHLLKPADLTELLRLMAVAREAAESVPR